ncbi:hypothetical protein BDN72DRAFT_305851 [Pluteus cervinus]|uniref:Uncharacterized protein n=1 Tax=Pluteus cervinus TaxID=181527 RepID=A0ACD3ACS8_9AGAR|nr:hypothetical protein BDN72DRAFT_305851 [Pluteus cervinus]
MISSMKLAIALTAIPAALAASFDVQVAPGGQLVFTPNTVTAAVGDTVNFTFNPANHTVTQSTFATPCTPSDGGLDSGFKPVTAGGDPVTFQVTVAATTPMWFFCKQSNHCAQGMVFAINPPATGNTFDAFQANAEGGGSASPSGASASGAASASSGASAASPSAQASGGGSSNPTGSAPAPSGSGSGGSGGSGNAAVSARGAGLIGVTGLVAALVTLLL